MLGSELWESKFDGLLSLVLRNTLYIDMWEIRKHNMIWQQFEYYYYYY